MMHNRDGGTVVLVVAMLAKDGGAGVNVDVVRGHVGVSLHLRAFHLVWWQMQKSKLKCLKRG